MLKRPELRRGLTPEQFAAWYWLKEELVEFCRAHSLPASGSKPQLAARVHSLLSGIPAVRESKTPRPRASMPDAFSLSSVIGPGWRCSPKLGAFMKEHCGKGFRFNAAMREFIHTQAGRTLQDAVDDYRAQAASGVARPEIPKQLEYNRHMRDFFAQNPGATRQQGLASWWARRARPTYNSTSRSPANPRSFPSDCK